MSWHEITGDLYKIPNQTNINFNPDAVLLHTPGLNVVMIEDSNHYPMSVPDYRFDEIQEIVQKENHIRSDESMDIYYIQEYLTYPEKIETNMIHDKETYLYEKEEKSFIFRVVSYELNNSFVNDSITAKEDNMLIEFLNEGMSVISKKSFKNYIEEGELYRLIALDKNARGLYKGTVKNPYWD